MNNLSYRSRSFVAFKAVCELCNVFLRYSCEIHFNDIDNHYLIFVSSKFGFVTSSFLSELNHELDKVGVSYDFLIKSVCNVCCIEIELYNER